MTEKCQTRSIATKIRAEQNGKEPTIEAYFAVFDSRYEFGPGNYETIAPAAFDDTLFDDIRALADHDTRLVLGRTKAGTLELKVDSHGLWGRITINPKDVEAMNLYERVKRGDVSNCSFGFDILDEERVENNVTGEVNWIVKKVKLYEVSIVTFPAYKDTIAQARCESNELYKARELQAWKERGLAKLRKNRK